MKTKLNGLDHLRALAIVMVFVYHYSRLFPHPEWMKEVCHFGWTGVDLFFVLSGYLIASNVFKTVDTQGSLSLKSFIIKRFFRIIPAYLVVVILYFLFPALHERETLAPLWKYLTFTQNIGLDIGKNGTFSHAWSLCIEEQFYLVFPVVILLLTRFKAFKIALLLLFLMFMFSFVVRLYSWKVLVAPFAHQDDFSIIWYKWIYYSTWCRMDGLLIGISIAALEQFKQQFTTKLKALGNWWLLAGLLVLTGAWYLCDQQNTFRASVFGFPLVDFGYGLLVVAAISPACVLYRFQSKITVNIAFLSYSIYLTHKMVIHVVQQQLGYFHVYESGNMMLLICISACVIIASILNKAVEVPFLRLRDRILLTSFQKKGSSKN